MSETTESPQSPEPEDTSADEPIDDEPKQERDDRSAVMLLGSGELSRELALAFQRLGREVIAVDRYADAPAHGVADRAAVVKMNDAEALTAIIERANPLYVVAESGVIAVDALVAAAERGLEVFPTPRSVRMSQDREGMRTAGRRRARPADRAVLVRRLGRRADRRRRARRLPAGGQAGRGRCRARASRCCCASTTSSRPGSARWPQAVSRTTGCSPRRSSRSTARSP